ncbi:hypothetical protein ABMA28_013861 [Loxostege sticticalis]|uniref:Uncharacterized protein n=1 Tax=Loxostege sticticalis TaxID=481309 RepID=A0ABD0TJS7_LOXSC
MFSLVILLCCAGALVSSAPQKTFYNVEDAHSHFEDFVQTYNKEYTNEAEKQARFEIFKNNLENINMKNKMSQSAVFGITQFSDLTQEEFTQTFTGCVMPGGETTCSRTSLASNATGVAAPENFDWRNQNKVTSVKNQQQCGSCWAFSTAGTIEGQYAMKHNQLVDLSPQQLVDCSRSNHGCHGGWMSAAILDTAEFGGLMSWQSYPYMASQGMCRANAGQITAQVTGCRNFAVASEEDLKQTLAQVGPLSIALAASSWNHYTGGIYDASMCDQNIDHAVLLVGYGTENGKPYWTIKNSWGSQWGESGYIRISRNQNTCNLMGSGQFVTANVQ